MQKFSVLKEIVKLPRPHTRTAITEFESTLPFEIVLFHIEEVYHADPSVAQSCGWPNGKPLDVKQ